ncbi:hypothetical protein [Comamonas kerstersii]|uniref:hypothetical protein n=1 Tax=Comamonas kerstersii TaxID=225992 RepID=UPI001B32D623|nr:hypothetical protein [Comamonas kerstersii]QTW19021.1 hypothetical protein H8N02_00570 [Comamonas kerstersii]
MKRCNQFRAATAATAAYWRMHINSRMGVFSRCMHALPRARYGTACQARTKQSGVKAAHKS